TSRGRSTETANGLAAIQAQLNNLGREIKKVNEKVYAAQVGSEQCKGPITPKIAHKKKKEKPQKKLTTRNLVNLFKEEDIKQHLQANSHSICRIGSSQYAVSTGLNNTLLYKSIQMTVPFLSHLDNHYCEEEEGNYGLKFIEAYGALHINNIIPRKEKDPGRLGELAHTRLTMEFIDRTVKYPKRIAENILVKIGKFTFPVDFIILDMLKDIKVLLILGRPFLSTARAKIDVYKRKFTLRVGEEKITFKRDDLMPTIEEGEVIEEFRTRDEDLDIGIDDYPRDNVVGALMNVPIFVGTFSVMTDFAVLEDMDAYRDEGMGDIIVG
ncbi:hypothetical protein Tco_1417715, partial [Tanacetum coccineum]